ncbi:MAG: hypothetical protein PHI11_13715 [Gallionella sp.]|nr:hypothetical protein [Gallionella sp.]
MSPSSANSVLHAPMLLALVRDRMLAQHYSRRIEETYINWIKMFVFFHHAVDLDCTVMAVAERCG